jgi:hypothetical protein
VYLALILLQMTIVLGGVAISVDAVPTSFIADGDITLKPNTNWPSIIIKLYSVRSKTLLYQNKHINSDPGLFVHNEDGYISAIHSYIYFNPLEERIKKVFEEELIIEYIYKSQIIGKFKLDSLKNLYQQAKSDPNPGSQYEKEVYPTKLF